MKKVLKKIYNSIPFKKELFSLLKFFWIPPHSVYKHLHFKSVFKVKVSRSVSFLINNYNSEIENDIFWKGLTNGWEKRSMKLWIQLCKEANVIMDIGANTGIYALTAKSVKPHAEVFAFEPLKRVMEKLRANNDLNGFNISCINKALSDKTGTAIIYEQDTEMINGATLNAENGIANYLDKKSEIETTTLDDFLEEKKIEKIDLLKIDVETYEPQVMEGYKKYLSIHKPTFLIEILTDEVGNKLEKFFDPLGYWYFNIDDKTDTIRRTNKLMHSDYFNYLICSEETARKLEMKN